MTRVHTVGYLDRPTVDGRVFREVILDEARLPFPIRSSEGTLLGQVVWASVVKTVAYGVQVPLSEGRVDVSCVWDDQESRVGEPDWSQWCLLAELTNLDCEVTADGIDVSGTLAGVTLSPHQRWPWTEAPS